MDKRFSKHWADTWKPSIQRFSNNSIIEISSDNRVLVEGHLGICQYNSCAIRVLIKTGCATISGENLYLERMTSEYLVICGRIDTISIGRRRL